MFKAYLFDWGDTLMVDFPDAQGKMCDWKHVEAIDGAELVLSTISIQSKIFIATSANESTESDIQSAFNRVGLDKYITGYFCKANLGLAKGTPEFYLKIVDEIGLQPNQVVMIGDTFSKDIQPAIQAGLSARWFNPKRAESPLAQDFDQFTHLCELIS
ncbi:HAD family hydrolase [Vibrio kyushuensis]|uniref:HAD family hydrolase n=1 Tax=Vibrio kyushuensis TaxID=2910249 RepID=UPI003D0E5BE9